MVCSSQPIIGSIIPSDELCVDNTSSTTTSTTLPFDGYTFLYSSKNGSLVMGTGETLKVGDPALITAEHTISVATEGVYIDGTLDITSTSTPVQTVTFETETFTATEVSSGVYWLYTGTLTVGGSAKTVRGQEVTAASTGLVVAAASTSASASATTSSTSGAAKLTTACWAGLVICGLLFSML